MITFFELIAKIRSYHPDIDEALIQKAYVFSRDVHGNQKRHSGDPYFSHPLAVAEILAELKLDQQSVITALLHDVVEDTDVTLSEIEKNFGEEIARLVDGVTKLGKIGLISSNQKIAENLRKLTLAMSQDIRVLLVKLADRLHNMRTLFYMPSKEKKIRKAQESLDIYAPLAGRIGLNKIKDELQELAFEIVDRESQKYIVDRLQGLREKNRNLIEKIIEDLRHILKLENIECEIFGREKKPYSIWMKMRQQNVGFHNLNDIMAFRIIAQNLSECYRILGVINSCYNMIPGTFKDYISTPKENGYQSLHMAILGPLNKKIEIQIRDHKMHEISELGVAAHWRYKEKFLSTSSKIKLENEQYRWIRDLINLFENAENPAEVLKQHKLQMHSNEVFCFTPDGDIFNLVVGSTVIDFAYEVHSEIGNSCVSAKVNGRIAPLRQELENGDQVEIVTAKNAKPSPNWLQFAATSKARSQIKAFIKSEKFIEYSSLGRSILNRFFASKSLELNDKILEKALPFLGKKTIPDLCAKVAEGIISRQEILKVIYPDFKDEINETKPRQNSDKKKSGHLLPIEGLITGMAMHYGGCCNPIPGDQISGVINTGTGVTIHNRYCSNLKNIALMPQRILDVCWKSDEEISEEIYSCRIRALVKNKSGSLADVSSIIAKKKVNISNIKIANRCAEYFELIIDIQIKNIDHLEKILSSLRISKKIIEVKRIAS
jgi:GTP pyrophosphokinase